MNYSLLVMLLKNLVILPHQEIKLELKDEISKNIIKISSKKFNERVLVVSPLKETNDTQVDDLPNVGVVAYIKNKIELNNGNLRVTLRGEKRVSILNYTSFSSEIIEALVSDVELPKLEEKEAFSILKKLKASINKYIDINHNVSNSIVKTLQDNDDINFLTDAVTSFLPLTSSKKLNYMREVNGLKRAYALIQDINTEIELALLEEKIDDNVQIRLEKEQQEFYLKEKLKEIEKQLGRKENSEVAEYEKKLNALKLEEKTHKKILDEIKKLKDSSNSPETIVIKNYLDWVLNLPWNTSSKENLNVKNVMNSLNKSHFGLKKVKDRVEEYIQLKTINPELSSPIICLVGPPGIGKTTISKSIASSLNREFYKISVGGLNDSLELVGNRRSYLGALPGKIMQGIKKCGTNNPVILIDEVDKMVKDYKGDPASTLLDILDANQNKTFIDNYIEEPFDLSKVMFILTANNVSDIPYTLLDRLEIIELSSYTVFEKIDIAKKHIIPQIITDFNLSKKINIKDETLNFIIDNYTREAGVRNLKRTLRTLTTKILNNKSYTIGVEEVIQNLDKADITKQLPIKMSGIAQALAYTPLGGTVLQVECSMYPGEEEIIITGSLGDVLKESAKVALSYIKEKEYVSNTNFYNQIVHLHLLNAATKKEGPSCGVAITTAILSKLFNVIVDETIGFTGEISLKGRILKVGGLKEKLIAAYNSGIKKVYIPEDNQNDLFDIPEQVIGNLEIKLVNNYETIYDEVFRKNAGE